MPEGIKIISGTSHPTLSKEVADNLGVALCNTTIDTFSDGEFMIQINENVRGTDSFVIQPTCPPVNDNLMELLLIIDALKRPRPGGLPL